MMLISSLPLAIVLGASQIERARGRTFKTPEQLEKESRRPRFSLSYVESGWKRRDPDQVRYANAQAEIYLNENERQKLADTLTVPVIAKLSRTETLRAMVAFNLGMSLGRQRENQIFARSDTWVKTYTTTEYKWRTLAHWSFEHDLRLVPAFQKLLIRAPNDWRIEVAYISVLLSRTQDAAVSRARALAKRYPKHFGSQEILAYALSIRGWQKKDLAMQREALRVLDDAKVLVHTPLESQTYQDRRARILLNMKGG